MGLNLVIGGSAGQGLKTLDNILSEIFFKEGFNLHSSKDYMSRIRGGHNFIKIRIDTQKKVTGPEDKEDILLALNKETIKLHKDKVSDEGLIIYNGEIEQKDIISLEAKKIAKEIGNTKVANIVFVGYLLKLLSLDLAVAKEVLTDYFASKGTEVKEYNLKALDKGYELGEKKFSFTTTKKSDEILIDGNQAIALGALAAGVKFYSAYPMTPSTSIMNYLAKKQEEAGIVIEQAEDEIAAINMAIGAFYSGARAMTATSGGGFALMNEGLGLAGITETPLVVAEVQRPGPATGLPTRTEQADLSFVINSSQGEFPLMVIAPRDAKDCFKQSFAAFNLAEKYQIPVIILSDTFMADSKTNIKEIDFSNLEINRGLISNNDVKEIDKYQRYKITDSGISPWAYPGQLEGEVVLADSDEHDENGNIIEDAKTRVEMVDKRARKLDKLKDEDLLEPLYNGEDNPEFLLISWGSNYGPTEEAYQLLKDDFKIAHLNFNHLWPLPTKTLKNLIDKDLTSICIENNSTGQLARLIKGEVAYEVDYNLLKYDGRPFSGKEIKQRIKREVIK